MNAKKYFNNNSIYKFLIFLFTIFLINSCIDNSSDNTLTPQEKFDIVKDLTVETDKNKANEEWVDNLYRNTKYRFRIEFPKNWEFLPGAATSILAKAQNKELGATIAVLVKHLPVKSKHPNDIWKNTTSEEWERIFNEGLKLQNTKAYNLEIKKGYLNNYNAYITTCNYEYKTGEEEYEYFAKQVQCNVNNKIYQVGINLPSLYYDEEMQIIFNQVIDSFKFENIY